MGLLKPKLLPEIQNKINTLNPIIFVSVPHVFGLPVLEGALSQLYYTRDEIVIDVQSMTFHLKLQKTISISTETSVNIQKAFVSSVGGAVLGGTVLGPLGAAIGGRAKEKVSREIKTYLIFTYKKDENLEQIAFDITHTSKAKKFATYFQRNQTQKASYDINL